MKSQQYLPIAAIIISFATCFPHFRPSRRLNTLANMLEDPEYVEILARTTTIGDFTSTISGFTVGNPGDIGALTTFSGTATANARVADSTSLSATSTTQGTKPHKTSSSDAPVATNPWNSACPVPSKFINNNFVSVSGKGGDASFTITYGNDTYTCPLSGTEVFANGYYDMNCDNGGRARVQTDRSSWISISEQFPCSAVAHQVARCWSDNKN
ncbi:hypothetical protein BDZ45DRAFT_9657 [Acephala macrosclerotiorum]|nr:hypothetical protein BDZ45DRAFT_9657 [Acephala macrosclerotiorum]